MSVLKIGPLLALALVANSAGALELSRTGSGQAVLLPFYSVVNGNSTVISVDNHADGAKAVRVIVAEGVNGRRALSFDLYLGARDSWSGAVVSSSSAASKPPVLVASDDSCTSLAIPLAGLPLTADAVSGSADDGLGSDVLRLHQGQIEVVELATLIGTAADEAASRSCNALRARFPLDDTSVLDPSPDLAAPSGGLSAEARLVDVEAGVAFDIPSVTFDDFSSSPRFANGSTGPNDVRIFKPTLESSQTEFLLEGGARIPASRPADAISFLLMASGLEAPFMLNDSMDASTRWILGLPTRPAYLDNRPGGELPMGSASLPPFAGPAFAGGAASCVPSKWRTIGREGHVEASGNLALCGQVHEILLYDDIPGDPSLFDPVYYSHSTQGVEAGRIRVDFDTTHALAYSTGSGAGNALRHGLPTVAFTLMEARNKAARPGLLAAYAVTGRAVRTED